MLILVVPFGVAHAESYDVFVTANSSLPGCEKDGSCWSDDIVIIRQYDEVTWHNDADFDITVTSGSIHDDFLGESFDSDVILPGGTYTHAFEDSGSFQYLSVLQPWMTGSVVVEPAADDATTTNDAVVSLDMVDSKPTAAPSEPAAAPSEPTAAPSEPTAAPPPEPVCEAGTEPINGICQLVVDDEPKPAGGGCLIATAAYGTELAPQVQFLREIRDNTVMGTASGALFMTGFNQLYYSFSPYIADMQRENAMLNKAVKLSITPMIASLSIMGMADSSEPSVALWGLSVIMLNVLMYAMLPAGIVTASGKVYTRLHSRNHQKTNHTTNTMQFVMLWRDSLRG